MKKLGRLIIIIQTHFYHRDATLQRKVSDIFFLCGFFLCVFAIFCTIWLDLGSANILLPLVCLAVACITVPLVSTSGSVFSAKIMTLFIAFVCEPYLYFVNGGLNGPMPLFFLINIIFTAYIFKGRLRFFLLTCIILFHCALFIFCGYYPGLFDTIYPREMDKAIGFSISLIITAVLGSIISISATNIFEIEHKKLSARGDELAEANARLIEHEQNLRNMVANIAHDLRTPVTSMSGALQFISQQDKAENGDLIETAYESSLRLKERIESLFELSRLDAGGVNLQQEYIRVDVFIEDLADFYATEFEQDDKEITVELARSSHTGAMVFADNGKLIRIFENLLENAKRYVPNTGGVIELGYTLRGSLVEFYVRDNGCGIPEALLPKIFERFFSAGDSIGGKAGGSGLGLTIVKFLVELHGGTIRCESSVGTGSCFYFTIPVV